MMSTVQSALANATERFTASDSPALDAQLLLAHVLGKDRAWLYAYPEHKLTREQQRSFDALCLRRVQGAPA